MGIKTGFARKKFGVKLPAAYENKEDSVFNRYQRAHMNAVEGATSFYASLLIAALHRPLPAVIAGGLYILGRYLYTVNYYKGVSKRHIGQPFYMLSQLYLWGSCAAFGISMFLENNSF